jgi:hypothetical protein
VIEVSMLSHQRSWQIWLSKRDHLPRKLKGCSGESRPQHPRRLGKRRLEY